MGDPFKAQRLPESDSDLTMPPDPAEALAVKLAVSEHRALEERIGQWAERYGEWREAQTLLDYLESRPDGAPEEFRAKVAELRIGSEAALQAVQLRLGR